MPGEHGPKKQRENTCQNIFKRQDMQKMGAKKRVDERQDDVHRSRKRHPFRDKELNSIRRRLQIKSLHSIPIPHLVQIMDSVTWSREYLPLSLFQTLTRIHYPCHQIDISLLMSPPAFLEPDTGMPDAEPAPASVRGADLN